MKTNFINIILCAAVAIGMTSCDLDQQVFSQMTSDNFPMTEEDASSLLTGLYGYIKNNSGGVNSGSANGTWGWPVWSCGNSGPFGLNENTTDEAYYLEGTQFREFTWGAGEDLTVDYHLNRNIARATYLLGVLDKMNIAEAKKNTMIAETKCIRATIMSCLYSLFGPVQMVLSPDSVDNIKYEPRPTKEAYFNQMVKDLTEAIPNLYDKTQGTSNWGRLNKGYANMLLMKLYMNDHQWAKAQTCAEAITKMGYKLSDDYFDAFKNEQSDETIWAIPSGAQADNELFFYQIPSDCANVCGQDVAPYWGVLCMPWSFYETFTANDVRKKGVGTTYIGPDGTLHQRYNNPGQRLQYGPIIVKYFLPKDKTSSGNFHQVCYRYADVILSLAEIENNLNGPTDKALNYLKQITDRAGTTSTIPADIQSSKEKFNEFLLAERGRELYYEGCRRDDLIRFGKFISNAKARGKDAKDYQVLFPIPSSVITESGGIVKNNAGY
jgi:hypothetical protein